MQLFQLIIQCKEYSLLFSICKKQKIGGIVWLLVYKTQHIFPSSDFHVRGVLRCTRFSLHPVYMKFILFDQRLITKGNELINSQSFVNMNIAYVRKGQRRSVMFALLSIIRTESVFGLHKLVIQLVAIDSIFQLRKLIQLSRDYQSRCHCSLVRYMPFWKVGILFKREKVTVFQNQTVFLLILFFFH